MENLVIQTIVKVLSVIEQRNLSIIDNRILLNVSKPLIYIDLETIDYYMTSITDIDNFNIRTIYEHLTQFTWADGMYNKEYNRYYIIEFLEDLCVYQMTICTDLLYLYLKQLNLLQIINLLK